MSRATDHASGALRAPTHGDNSEPAVWSWYQNVPLDIARAGLTPEEESHIVEYYEEAGLLRPSRRNFFRAHFGRAFANAARSLLGTSQSHRILDLGCGAGTQSLYFACQGAHVTALDMDETALSVFRKRIVVYEQLLGRKLKIDIVSGNVFAFDFAPRQFDGIYSMFAFNMMQPSRELLKLMLPSVTKGGRIAITDGNNVSWLARIVPSRRRNVLSPVELATELERSGFRIVDHRGGIVLPPPAWRVGGMALTSIDDWLSKSWFWPISQQLIAEKF